MTKTAYDLSDRLYQLAPWDWMDETRLIAIENPQTSVRDHISIMGQAGNHYSLALYRGLEARRRFNLIQEARDLPQEDILALILDTPQLQCSFSERTDLFKSEFAAIKQAGKKYRGEAWPSFRSFRPGRCPIPAAPDEVEWLCTAIENVLEVAPTLAEGADTFRYEAGRPEILTRVCDQGAWKSIWTQDDSTLHAYPRPAADEFLLEKIRLHARAVPLETQFMLLPDPVGKSRETSIFPYLLLIVEPKSHFIIGVKTFSVEETSYEDLMASIPTELLRLCDKNSIRPASMAVTSPATHALLSQTAQALGIRCDLKKRLPALEQAVHSLMGFTG
jgi:hypothetical protein